MTDYANTKFVKGSFTEAALEEVFNEEVFEQVMEQAENFNKHGIEP